MPILDPDYIRHQVAKANEFSNEGYSFEALVSDTGDLTPEEKQWALENLRRDVVFVDKQRQK